MAICAAVICKVVEPNSRLGLLQSVVTNSLLLPLAVKKEAVVRLSGSHLIMCMGAIQTGYDAYVYEAELRSVQRAKSRCAGVEKSRVCSAV